MIIKKCSLGLLCSLFVLFGSVARIFAHGIPLGISVINGNLTVDTSLYFDSNLGKFNTLGPFRYTNLPALSVDEMQVGDFLNYRFIPRTSISNPNDSRYLWYWDGMTIGSPNSDLLTVENSESSTDLVNLPQSVSLIDNELLAAIITDEILDEPDSHVLNFYVQPVARTGVYGFYGRFESPGYGASEPFWLLINNGLDVSAANGASGAFTTQTVPISPGRSTVTWNAASGNWNTTSENWTGGSPTASLYKEGDNVVFNDSATGGTISIPAGGVSPSSTIVNNDLAHPYVFENAGADVNGIKTGNLTKSGLGTLAMNSVNTYTGTTTVMSGLLDIGVAGSIDSSPIIIINAAGSLLTNHIRTNSLTIEGDATIRLNGGNDGASKVETLTMSVGGKLNLSDNDLVVGTGSVSDIRLLIKDGTGGSIGITSGAEGFGVKTGFGYAAGNDPNLSPLLGGSLAGQNYTANSVLIKYTFLGDADLDGDSDLNDLGLWASNFTGDLGNPIIPEKFWAQGDFDYDGDTDLNDLGLWSSTFTGDLGGDVGSFIVNAPDASTEVVAILGQMGFTVVPEPSMIAAIGMLAFAALLTIMRRKQLLN